MGKFREFWIQPERREEDIKAHECFTPHHTTYYDDVLFIEKAAFTEAVELIEYLDKQINQLDGVDAFVSRIMGECLEKIKEFTEKYEED